MDPRFPIREARSRLIEVTGTKDKKLDANDAKHCKEILDGEGRWDENDYETYDIACLADLRATAVIVKEIIFNQRFQIKDCFIGLDIGTGSGILALANFIAGKRKGAREIHVAGCEVNSLFARRARRTLSEILSRDQFAVLETDATQDSFWNELGDIPFNFVVSETISHGTPPMVYRDGQFEVTIDENFGDTSGQYAKYVSTIDPFPILMRILLSKRPSFVEDVRSGRVALFPDIANGDYIPELGKSRIFLRTDIGRYPVLLPRIGEEFSMYEDLGCTMRWGANESASLRTRNKYHDRALLKRRSR